MTPRKQRGKIRRTNIYTKGEDQTDKYIYTIRLNNRPPLKQRGRSDGHIYIYTIRLNNMTPLKQRGKVRRTHIYTKGENLTNTYIY
jgi:hypothetical protein